MDSDDTLIITATASLQPFEVKFRIKKNAPLSRLKLAYCDLKNMRRGLSFTYNGQIISDSATPNSLGIVDGGNIMVHFDRIEN